MVNKYNGRIVYDALVVSAEMKRTKQKTSYDAFVIQDFNLLEMRMPSSLRIMSANSLKKALKLLFDIELDLSLAYLRSPTYEEVRLFLRNMQVQSYEKLRADLQKSREDSS